MTARIAVNPVVTTYNDYERMLMDLTVVENNTTTENISEPEQLALQGNFKTMRGQYYMSTTALGQLCGLLCPHLNRLLVGIGGFVDDPENPQHPGLAAGILNKLIQLRFKNLKGHSLLINLKDKRIDGIVKDSTVQLTNKHFFDMVTDSTRSSTEPLIFHDGNLHSRSINLCYIYPDVTIRKPEEYYHGYYFSNSEVVKSCVKIGGLLVRKATRDRASIPAKYGRIHHQSRDITPKVRQAIYRITARGSSRYGDFLGKRLPEMMNTPLGFAGLTNDQQIHRAQELTARLGLRGMSKSIGQHVVYSALFQASKFEAVKSYQEAEARAEWGQRTLYDLFTTLIRYASTRYFMVREMIERVAYEIVLNKMIM